MRWLTDALYLLTALVTAPFWLTRMAIRGRLRTDWAGRFGRGGGLGPSPGKRILLHAVSVGEVNAIRTLVSLLERQSDIDVVVASTTDTGFVRAKALFGQRHTVVRYPLDFSWSTRRFLDRFKPDVVGLVELEVWPNFVAACRRRRIPVMVVNGRLSERSFRRYRLVRWLLRPSFGRLAGVIAQSEEYARRFVAMGVPTELVQVAGSLKWDNATFAPVGADDLATDLGVDRDRLLVVAGSTAPEEHRLLHEATPRGVQLMCAPRRPEWFDSAAATLEGCTRRSAGSPGSNPDRFLLDTIGELSQAYALADVVVVGRSFGDRHGSDVAEPAGMGKPVVVGPAVEDFQDMVAILREAGGLIQCTAEDLPGVLQGLADDQVKRTNLAARGLAEIEGRQGASQQTLQALVSLAGAGA